jgi:hypothetical protein
MTKLKLSFNKARCYAGVDNKGKPYAFVKIPSLTAEGVSVSVNVDPTEWYAIASNFNMFDVVELPVEKVEVDPSGRTDSNGVPYRRAVNPSWGEAEILKKGFGPMPSYETLYRNAEISRSSVASAAAAAEADM